MKSAPGHNQFQTDHMPVASEEGIRRNCFVCYKEGKGEKKVSTYCTVPQCQKFLQISQNLIVLELFTPQVMTDRSACVKCMFVQLG